MSRKYIHDKLLKCIDYLNECNPITNMEICYQCPNNRNYFKQNIIFYFYVLSPTSLKKFNKMFI